MGTGSAEKKKDTAAMDKAEQLQQLQKFLNKAITNGLCSQVQLIDKGHIKENGIDDSLLDDEQAQVFMSKLGVISIERVKNKEYIIFKLDQKIVEDNRSVKVLQQGEHPFFKPSWYKELLACLQNGENVFMVGPTGCGKTTVSAIVAKDLDRPFYRMNLNGETTVDNFVGSVRLTNKETVFTPGILVQAMEAGGILLLDEVDSGQPEVLFTLHSVLEGKPIILYEDGARVVKPSPGFCVIGAANTLGRGDDSGLYAGTNVLNEAFLDRFTAVFHMEYSEKEREILKHYTDDKTTEKIMAFSKEMRTALADNKILTTMSTRRIIELAKKAKEWGIYKAYEYIIHSRVSSDDRETVRAYAHKHSLTTKTSEKMEM